MKKERKVKEVSLSLINIYENKKLIAKHFIPFSYKKITNEYLEKNIGWCFK